MLAAQWTDLAEIIWIYCYNNSRFNLGTKLLVLLPLNLQNFAEQTIMYLWKYSTTSRSVVESGRFPTHKCLVSRTGGILSKV